MINFPKDWKETAREAGPPPGAVLDMVDDTSTPLAENAGATFSHGLFRFHNQQLYDDILPILRETYPGDDMQPFAFDWMGRQFAWRDRDKIVIYDVGWNDRLVADCSMEEFFAEILPNEVEDLLRLNLWHAWQERTGATEIAYSDCVGYKVPIFLGGDDAADNLELTEMVPHWKLVSQLASQVRELPEGTDISSIQLENE